jgi:predicted XRE-type DNA-binding protein
MNKCKIRNTIPSDGRRKVAFTRIAPFTLINIRQLPHKVTRQDKELGFCFEAFRCTSHSDPYEAFQEALMDPIFKVYFDALSKELRNLVLSYLGNCIDRNKHSLADLANLVSSNSQEKEDIMTSIAQAIRQEGMQQGMQQEKLHIAKNMLSKLHLDIKAVKEATGLSEEELIKLQEEAQR